IEEQSITIPSIYHAIGPNPCLCPRQGPMVQKSCSPIYHILQHFDNKDFCETCNLSCDGKESRDLDEKRQSLSKSDKRTL
ncbi:hypothetical protein MSG28_008324, partial [Choristoneura fumiferana]